MRSTTATMAWRRRGAGRRGRPRRRRAQPALKASAPSRGVTGRSFRPNPWDPWDPLDLGWFCWESAESLGNHWALPKINHWESDGNQPMVSWESKDFWQTENSPLGPSFKSVADWGLEWWCSARRPTCEVSMQLVPAMVLWGTRIDMMIMISPESLEIQSQEFVLGFKGKLWRASQLKVLRPTELQLFHHQDRPHSGLGQSHRLAHCVDSGGTRQGHSKAT